MLTIKQLRKKIERTDAKIIEKLAERQELSKKIGQLKLEEGRAIIDLSQEKQLFEFYNSLSEKNQLQQDFVHKLFKIIIAYSRMVQKK